MTEPSAAEAFLAFVGQQLAEERARKSSLEARGLTLVTASGAFVTLTLAIAAAASHGTVHLAALAKGSLLAALVLFLFAAALGVWCNRPLGYDEPQASGLWPWIEGQWDKPRDQVLKALASADTSTLTDARKQNDRKACWLLYGVACQVLGMVASSVAAAAAVFGW